jgi:hypothetical protein
VYTAPPLDGVHGGDASSHWWRLLHLFNTILDSLSLRITRIATLPAAVCALRGTLRAAAAAAATTTGDRVRVVLSVEGRGRRRNSRSDDVDVCNLDDLNPARAVAATSCGRSSKASFVKPVSHVLGFNG